MRPGIIECAFDGACGKDPVRRTAQTSGREYVTFSVAVGEGDDTQWLDVACFGPAVDAAMTLVKGDRVYIEGKLSVRKWEAPDGIRWQLSVAAAVVQPKGKIGDRKPKRTRMTTAAKAREANAASAAVHQPLPFNDEIGF